MYVASRHSTPSGNKSRSVARGSVVRGRSFEKAKADEIIELPGHPGPIDGIDTARRLEQPVKCGRAGQRRGPEQSEGQYLARSRRQVVAMTVLLRRAGGQTRARFLRHRAGNVTRQERPTARDPTMREVAHMRTALGAGLTLVTQPGTGHRHGLVTPRASLEVPIRRSMLRVA
jgi:hypothetical protein